MDNQEPKFTRAEFRGDGADFFGIYLLNAILMIFTLGLYYPWAKAKKLKYLYEQTFLDGSRFKFHGTGEEMFKGFLKAVGIFIVLYEMFIAFSLVDYLPLKIAGILITYILFIALIPLAIHGSLKYRLSRSSWRGIHFGYRGDRNELINEFLLGALFTFLSIGLYSAWFTTNLRRYIIGNIRFGDIKFSYTGSGSDYFAMLIIGYLLTFVTLGIYSFWFAKDLFNYYVENIILEQDGKEISLRSVATAGSYFRLAIGNLVIVFFTFGLGTPWAIVRTIRFVFNNVYLMGDLDFSTIKQTETEFTDATGDDMVDMLDIGLV